MRINIKLEGFEPIVKWLDGMTKRAQDGPTRNAFAARALKRNMQDVWGTGQQPVASGPRKWRAGQKPFRDTGTLYDSLETHSDATVAIAGTKHIRGTLDNDRERFMMAAKYFAIPLSPPLSPGEARAYNNARVPGGRVLGLDGKGAPEGPGVYRRTTHAKFVRNDFRKPNPARMHALYERNIKEGRGVWERVKAFVKVVRRPARTFAKPNADWIQVIRDKWLEWTITGKGLS